MIFSTGEILADMIAKKEDGRTSYTGYAGGAPFNLACAAEKYGAKCVFYGCVGNDKFGDFLSNFAKERLASADIEKDDSVNTTLAFVDLDQRGERSFSFYRKNTADYRLKIERAKKYISECSILHLGSLILSEKQGRKYADRAIDFAKKNRKLVSFDVNYRSDIFQSDKKAIEIYGKYIKRADIVKFSSEEIDLFTRAASLEERMIEVRGNDKDKFIAVTLGKDGSAYLYGNDYRIVSSVQVTSTDTTGAGDAFFGALLSRIDQYGFNDLNHGVYFSNIVGALTTTKKGAIDGLPDPEEIAMHYKSNNCKEVYKL